MNRNLKITPPAKITSLLVAFFVMIANASSPADSQDAVRTNGTLPSQAFEAARVERLLPASYNAVYLNSPTNEVIFGDGFD